MGPLAAELPVIGRETERARLLANVARGRHTLLVGPIGAGKTHLLRAVGLVRPLDAVNDVFTALEAGEIVGRAVLEVAAQPS